MAGVLPQLIIELIIIVLDAKTLTVMEAFFPPMLRRGRAGVVDQADPCCGTAVGVATRSRWHLGPQLWVWGL